MSSVHEGSNGFTLIELVVVVAVIGILAAIAVVQLYGFAARAKQSEARELLSTVYTAETAYYGEQNQYGTLANAGFTPSAPPKYYSNLTDGGHFGYVTTSTPAFSASCSKNLDSDPTIDVWQISNAAREPKVVSNDIQN